MTKTIGNTERDERGLLPYPVIIAATKGDPQAMQIVVQHYESQIAYRRRSLGTYACGYRGIAWAIHEL